jgi:uridine phosphorylase
MRDCRLFKWLSKEKRSVVEPQLLVPRELNNAQLGIVVFLPRVYNWMKKAVHKIMFMENDGFFFRSYFVTEEKLAVFHSYFGAPLTVMLVEALIAGGINKLIIFGEAGAISSSISSGEVLIPTFAIREEGTSYHYLPPGAAAKPSRQLQSKIKRLLAQQSISFKEGGVWTIDAFFREPYEKVLKYSRQGVLGIDMECAAIFSVARFRKVQAASLLLIADELSTGSWKLFFHTDDVIKKEKKVSELLVNKWYEFL